MKCCWTVPIIALMCAFTSPAATALRVFHIGNSLTEQAYGMHDIARGKGYTPIVWGRFMIPNAPIHWCWSHHGPADVTGASITGDVVTVLQNNAWDVLVLQLFSDNGDNAQTMTESGGNFAQAAYTGNPDCQVYVFGSYPRQRANWPSTVMQLNQQAVDGAAGISARFPARKRVLVIPVMQALDSMRILIGAGQGGGVTSLAGLFSDDQHASNEGLYIEQLVHFSTIYRADPHGAVIAGLYYWEAPVSVSQQFATVAQNVAWNVVRNYPQSGVTGTGVRPTEGAVAAAAAVSRATAIATLSGRIVRNREHQARSGISVVSGTRERVVQLGRTGVADR